MSADALKADSCPDTLGSLDLEAALALATTLAAEHPPPVPMERPVDACGGRILAEAILAPDAVPAFDMSAVDGYALCRAELATRGSVRLRVTRTIRAGETGRYPPTRVTGTALRMAANAPVPRPFDAVVSRKDVTEHDGWIGLHERPIAFENIRRAGGVATRGAPLLPAGQVLGARDTALLAASGHGTVPVRRKLKVAVLSIGAELLEAGAAPAHGLVPDASRPMILAELSRPWIAPRDLGIVRDDARMLAQRLDLAATENRAIIVLGGQPGGNAGPLRDAIRQLGGVTVVPGLAMTPGETTLIARLGDAMLLGLSGNPVSAHLLMRLVGWPLLHGAAGLPDPEERRSTGTATFTWRGQPGQCAVLPIRIADRTPDGHPFLGTSDGDDADTRGLARADGYARIDPGTGKIDPGDRLCWVPF